MTINIGGEDESILTNLVHGTELQSVLRKRRSKYIFETVKKGTEDVYIKEGWEISRKNKKSTRMQKLKPFDEALEDEIWCLLAKMDFVEMNDDREFKIPVTDGPYPIPPKQIDVFAFDEDTIIFVECKASASSKDPIKRSFQKDINEIVGLKRKLMNSVNKHYNPDNKLKASWIFATRNVIWSKPDLARAKEENITVIKDDDIDYYKKLVNHLGSAAKFQLLAELFENTEIPGLNTTVPAVKGEMGGTPFYTFVIEPAKLLKIAFICHRSKMDKKALDSYQRMLTKSRLKNIKEYIENDGLFPTNIVLNIVSNKKLRFDPILPKNDLGAKFGTLYLPNKYKSAWVIDGQHRLYGFSGSSHAEKAKVPVIAFENMLGPKQAKMFVDINSKQVRVPTNLLTELYSDLLWDSKKEDERLLALTSRVVIELEKDLESPLKNKIIFSGKKRDKTRPITNTTLNTAINKRNLVGNVPKRSNQLYPGPLYDKSMESSLERAKEVLSVYFNVFKEEMPDHWETGSGEGGYLCTNNGLSALIIVLKNILDHVDKKSPLKCTDMPTDELIEEILPYAKILASNFSKLSPEEVRRYRDQLGEHGKTRSAYGMMEMIHLKFPVFEPHGLSDYIISKSTEFTKKARTLVPEMQLRISEFVISLLKREFGEENRKWWFEGIPEPVRKKAAVREQEDSEHKPQEKQLDLIDYKEIANKKWQLFKEPFSPDPNMSKAKALSWLDEMNRIRRKIAHPERGQVSEEEYIFLEKINELINDRLTLG